MFKRFLMLVLLSGCGSGLPNDSVEIIAKDGKDGLPGKDGENGQDGVDGEDGQDGAAGQNGANGLNGSNGHSLVTQSRVATALECPLSSGTAVDIFIDIDDSYAVSFGDIFQSGLVACNGVNGVNGSNALASVTGFSFSNTTTCRNLGDNFSANKSSSNSDSVRIFPNSSCSGSSINTLSEGGDEIYQASDSLLFVLEGNNSGSVAPLTLRKMVFSL